MRLKNIGKWAALAVLFAAFLWAFDGVVLTPWVMELGLTDVPTFVFMLHAVASVFLFYFLIKKRSELKRLNKADWRSFILVGLFGGAIGTMAIIAAIIKVYSADLNITVVLMLQKLQPIFAILLAILWLKERPQNKFFLWAGLGLFGSYFLTFGLEAPNFSAQGMFVPALLAIVAAFSFGSSTVFSKKAVTKISHSLSTALRFIITTGIMVVVILIITALNSLNINTGYEGIGGFGVINWNLIGAFMVIALTTGGTAIFIYYWGLKRVLAARATIYEMMFPVSAIVLEFFIHDKILSAGQWMGAGVVIIAITVIVNLKPVKNKQIENS
ncbi:DMT family transporter [Patescibacteria group bacterium]|nr:DMT family transporter [Patescibacteria group bacterium]MBU0963490.1 DMT family transporter [Patescibacteria group bacterium]